MNWALLARVVAALWLSGFCQAAPFFSWEEGHGYRSRTLSPGPDGHAGFTWIDPQASGILFTNQLLGDAFLTNAVAHNGSGIALGDVDGDGRTDIYLCSLQGPNHLYRNLGGWRFEERDAGPASCRDQLSTGAAFADIEGDGDLDLLVNGIAAGTRLFLNDGTGRWSEAEDAGLSRTNSATSMALADIDGDGDLDLYCAHYIDVMHLADPTTRFALSRLGGKWEVTKVNGESTRAPKWRGRFEALEDGSVRELPEAHALYRNDGKGRFTPIQQLPGIFQDEQGKAIAPPRDWGLAAMFRDVNRDGAPDLYVCNDNASPDRFWINTGRGAFRAADAMALRHTSRSSMGVDFADIDRDGRDDFFVADMLARDHAKRQMQLAKDYPDPRMKSRVEERPRYNRNTLFLGRGDGTYAEAALMAGLAASDWSWCPIFLDIDLDGYDDLLVSNGFAFDVMDQDSHDQLRARRLGEAERKRSRQFHPAWVTPNAAFRNRGDGTFEDVSGRWGFDRPGISYGMALGDLDNDGDLDLVVNNLNEAAGLYRNDASGGRVAVRLKGAGANSFGIGARVELKGSVVQQGQEMIAGGRYMSGDETMRVFAVSAGSEKLRLEVRWRGGGLSIVTNVQANRIYEIEEADREGERAPETVEEPFFREVSGFTQQHAEAAFDDWARQPSLPRSLSSLGPGVGWQDLDADGWQDLIVAGGRGGSLAVYRNQEGQSFDRVEGLARNAMDQGSVVAWSTADGRRALIVAGTNYELPTGRESELGIYAAGNLHAPERLSAGFAGAGPLAVADIDGDGDLDLFTGGRCRAARYPEPVSSALWRNELGELRRDAELSGPFEALGMASGATFCDLDGDGDADLAVAVEWGPLRVFLNKGVGVFEDATRPLGLEAASGLWTSVTAGDFNGDGRMDLAAGNAGRNTPYELYLPGPWRAWYFDEGADGNVEIVEAFRDGALWRPMRNRAWLGRALPELAQRFASHADFSKGTIEQVLGNEWTGARWVEAAVLESSVFLNRGSSFERFALPRQAQLSPVHGITIGDFDGDGAEDLFLAQNNFGSASDLSREDAGRGLWLRGLGDGTFAAIDGAVSGVKLYGEQRGAATADFDGDGRIDLAIAQNSGETWLFRNERGRPGLKVRLRGPAGNPDAIGAQVRMAYGDGRRGPARAVQGGSGYGSQDGLWPVLGLAGRPESVQVRWPGGVEQIVPIPDGATGTELRMP